MSPDALGRLIAPALGIAISPVSIATVILLLLSPRARSTSIGFLLGWSFGIAGAVTGFALLSGVVPLRVPGAAHAVLAVIQLVVGILLLALAALVWRRRSPAGDEPRTPAWMRAVDRATFPLAFAVGFMMAVNPPNLLLSLSGGVAIGLSGLSGSAAAQAIGFFTLVAASTVLIPVVGHLIAADALQPPLHDLRRWLVRRSTPILIAVFSVLGLVSVAQGLGALATG